MTSELVGPAVSVLVASVTAMVLWNWWLTRTVTDLRLQIASQYHSKADVDAIIERVMLAISKQIKADLAPLRFRLREISHALKIPPEIPQDDHE